MSNAQHWALNKQPATKPGDLTPAQKQAYRETGVAMSDSEARMHLRAQADLQRVSQLHRHVAGTAAAAAIDKAKGCSMNCSQGHACTCSPTAAKPSHAKTYTSSKSLEQAQVEALIETDAELVDYVGAVLRSRWTKAAALLLASTVTLLMLTGCGGGGSAAEPEVEFVPAIATSRAHAAATATPAAEIFGDSTMVRIYADQRGDAVAYADIALGQPLINSAVSGSTADSVTPERIAASPAPSVVLNWAINDTDLSTPDRYRANLTRQADAARRAGKTVVLLESTPIVPGGRVSSHRSEPLRVSFEAIKRQVAVDTGSYYCAFPPKTWTLADKPDGVHEHDTAAQWKGRVLADCLMRASAD